MILIDFSQIVISNAKRVVKDMRPEDFNEDFIRHMVMESIRGYKKRYGRKYGDIVIAVDSRRCWRYEVFPEYKAVRKQNKKESDFDFELVHRVINETSAAFKEFFQYKVIYHERAEADDIIGVLTRYKHKDEKIMIISADYDFKQLHKYRGVSQYSPIQSKAVTCDAPVSFLKEHIIRGDKGDGIPNVLTHHDFFVDKKDLKRQKSITVGVISDIDSMVGDDEFIKNRFAQNEQLIDLNFIPDDIKKDILELYDNPVKGSKADIMNYMLRSGLNNLVSDINDF